MLGRPPGPPPGNDGWVGDPLRFGLHPAGPGVAAQRPDARQGGVVPVVHLATLDAAGRVVSVNGPWRTFAELSPGGPFPMPETGANFLDACQQAADQGNETAREALLGIGAVLAGTQRLFTMEYTHTDAQGPQWFVAEVTPLDGAGGVAIAHQDVTERRMFEQAVAHFALRYWTVSEQSSDYAYEIHVEPDGELKAEWITEAFTRVTGYGAADLAGCEAWCRLFHPADLPLVRRHFARLQDGEPDVAEFRIVGQSGEVRWLRNQARPVWDGWAGRVVALDGAAQDVTEQKRAEEDLERSRLRLQAFFDHTLDAIVLAGDDGRLVDANPAACTLLGYGRDELLRLHVWELMAADQAGPAEASWEAFLATGQQRGEHALRRRDGGLVEAEYRSVAHILPGLHLSVLRDVTERNRVVAALRTSEERFRALVQNASDFVSVVDENGLLQFVSPSVERVLGLRPADLIGTVAFEHVHPDDRAPLLALFQEGLRGERDQATFTYRQRDAAGGWVYLEATGANLLDNPAVRGIVVNSRDVSARRAAEEALRQSEERWRLLVDNHPEPILVSVGDQIVFSNRAGAVLAGTVAAEDVAGRALSDFVSAEHMGHLEARRRTVEAGEVPPVVEYTLIRLDGDARRVEARSVPVTYNGQRAMQTVLRDVTERRRYEQGLIAARDEAERAARLRATILANMSHEIRTPLTTVLGFAEILVEELEGGQRELAQLIERGGRRLSQTLNAVLDLARLESGGLELHPETVDVVARVGELADAARAQLGARPVRLDLVPAREVIPAHVDVGVVCRVVNHLLDNAVKFTDHGVVTVRLDACDDRIVVQVEDTGVGISPAFLPHLFDEFEQESTGLSRSYEGSGLGLTITKRLLDLVGGTIDVASEKGKGSTFTVHLPRYMALAALSSA